MLLYPHIPNANCKPNRNRSLALNPSVEENSLVGYGKEPLLIPHSLDHCSISILTPHQILNRVYVHDVIGDITLRLWVTDSPWHFKFGKLALVL